METPNLSMDCFFHLSRNAAHKGSGTGSSALASCLERVGFRSVVELPFNSCSSGEFYLDDGCW
jgi:hypothetical protein